MDWTSSLKLLMVIKLESNQKPPVITDGFYLLDQLIVIPALAKPVTVETRLRPVGSIEKTINNLSPGDTGIAAGATALRFSPIPMIGPKLGFNNTGAPTGLKMLLFGAAKYNCALIVTAAASRTVTVVLKKAPIDVTVPERGTTNA
jgi:hypothetical protein